MPSMPGAGDEHHDERHLRRIDTSRPHLLERALADPVLHRDLAEEEAQCLFVGSSATDGS
jgi:hypothetical protein